MVVSYLVILDYLVNVERSICILQWLRLQTITWCNIVQLSPPPPQKKKCVSSSRGLEGRSWKVSHGKHGRGGRPPRKPALAKITGPGTGYRWKGRKRAQCVGLQRGSGFPCANVCERPVYARDRLVNENVRDTLAIVRRTFVKLTFANVRDPHLFTLAKVVTHVRRSCLSSPASVQWTSNDRSFPRFILVEWMFGFWIILQPSFFYSRYSLSLIRIINYTSLTLFSIEFGTSLGYWTVTEITYD